VISRIGDVVIELMEVGALVPENKEPDHSSYAEYLKTDEYARDFDDAFGNPIAQIEDFINSLKG